MKKNRFILLFLCLFLSITLKVLAQSDSASITNYVSNRMQYKLISEAQCASDLASFYGYSIEPLEIMDKIPLTDDPNTGYVGYYDDEGGLPPNSYGVYQQPLSKALQTLGVPAYGYQNYSLDQLKTSVRQGNPVICWVVGNTAAGTPVEYTPSSGQSTTVALHMNSVTVTGFDQSGLLIWDNGESYTRSYEAFEASWGVLGNRALVIMPDKTASDKTDWWGQPGDEFWDSEQTADEPTPLPEITIQKYPVTETEDYFSFDTEQDQNDQFGVIPEVTPDFDWNSSPNSEDYVGWFWFPEDESANNYSYDNNTFMPFSGSFGNLNDIWDYSQPLPTQAYVDGFVGHAQSYPLDCETRSAVDFAAYFGFSIDAYQFLTSLPKSDDPNEGFVGNYTDPRGQIPPASYGVYQEPVAALLRSYGVPAVGYKNMSWERIKYEISNGRPVMVWVAGNTEVGTPQYYTPSNGKSTKVVPYQHTVVVIGYDSQNVTIQDGAMRYTRSINTFLTSWATLDNRGIIAVY